MAKVQGVKNACATTKNLQKHTNTTTQDKDHNSSIFSVLDSTKLVTPICVNIISANCEIVSFAVHPKQYVGKLQEIYCKKRKILPTQGRLMYKGKELNFSLKLSDYKIHHNDYIVFTDARNFMKVYLPGADVGFSTPLNTANDIRCNIRDVVGQPVFTFACEGHLLACNGNAIFENGTPLNDNKELIEIVGLYHNLLGPVAELCVTNETDEILLMNDQK